MLNLPANLKGAFPFRLGTTSFIVPGEILQNVELLCGTVDDVELLALESEDLCPLPSEADIGKLARIAGERDLSYTVHLPLDIDPGSGDAAARTESVRKILGVMRRFDPLRPLGWILHLPRCAEKSDTDSWQASCRRFLVELLDSGRIEPRKICVENLNYDFSVLSDMVGDLDLSVCMDAGHLIRDGRGMLEFWNDWKSRVRVIHLHGVDGKRRDHRAIAEIDSGLCREIFRMAASDRTAGRVLTLEVFNVVELEKSLRTAELMRSAICPE